MRDLVLRARRSQAWVFPAVVILVALLAAWPAIAQPGLLNTRGGGDSPFLLQRLHQLTAALAGGHLPARWMPDANYGYGYPFYNYYAPLSIYIAAAFRFLGFSFVRAIHLAQLAGFVVAGLGVYYLARRWFGSAWAGLLAAVAYTVAPFHLVNVYVRGDSLAEFWAMAFYPLVLLAADGLLSAATDRDGWSAVSGPLALFALAYAALVLSHNISALIFSPFLLLYLALRLWADRRAVGSPPPDTRSDRRLRPVVLLLVIAALVLALALAAWFFVPALLEQDLAQLDVVTEGYFHFSNHFRGRDLVQLGLLFDYNPDGGIAFRLGLPQVVLALAGAATLIANRRRAGDRPSSPRVLFLLVGALIATLMITPLSRFLWEHLPLLSFAQFPWRFLSVAGLFGALLTGALVLLPSSETGRAMLVMAGGLALVTAGLLGLRTDHLILTDADVTAERLAQYEWFTGNIGSTVSAEYLPPEAAPRPYTSNWLNEGARDAVVALDGALTTAALETRAPAGQTWTLDVGEDGATVLFPTLYWRGWTATIDDQPATPSPQPGSGLMSLEVPAGQHEIILALGKTPVRLAAEWLSLVAAGLVIALLVIAWRSRPARNARAAWPVAVGAALVAVVLLILGLVWRRENVTLPNSDLNWDFAQMGYLHHSPGGVPFDNGARLFAYGYSADEVAAGQTLTVTVSLNPGESGAATLALVTPATARPVARDVADPPILVAQTQAAGETTVFSLTIPDDAPAGPYIPRLILDEARPLTPSGQTRGDLFLRPLRVLSGADASDVLTAPLPGDEGRPFVGDMDTLSLALRDPQTLDGRFAWVTALPIGGRYQLSWRLQDGSGGVVSQLDTQPGYGFQPTTGWQVARPVYDWLALRLPSELTGPAPHALVLILYDPVTGEELLRRGVGEVTSEDGRLTVRPIEPVFAVPPGIIPLDVTLADTAQPQVGLRGYALEQTDDRLQLTLYWEALHDMSQDYRRFVHLIDAGGRLVSQVDGHPASGAYPTGQWLSGEVVEDQITFDLTTLPSGAYHLGTGFYRPLGEISRLEARSAEGLVPEGLVRLPAVVTVKP